MNCREASREEKASRDNLEAIKVDVQQAEQDFRRLVPRVNYLIVENENFIDHKLLYCESN